ncbi:MAG: capsule assembly Wzi family protein [Spirochaetia bacterium]|nr:capsule assembly Wzi family protein [Spirochaetia bacterium]
MKDSNIERPTLNYKTSANNIWDSIDEEHENDTKSFKKIINKDNLKFYMFYPELFNSYNSNLLYGYNDRGLWQGKGYNAYFSSGFYFSYKSLSINFKPQINFSQNKEYEFYPATTENKYGYYVNNIDLPQRFGNSPYFSFDFADTEIRYNYKTFTIGFGTENPWLGPAQINPMLGSTNAAGYPKIDIGFNKTNLCLPFLDYYLGKVELRIANGCLIESQYYDSIKKNDYRMLNLFSIAYEPSFIPGFSLGINRIFITYWKPENFKYIWRLFTTEHSNALASSGNDEDQKIAIFVDWLLPSAGFEFYGELGIDDFTNDSLANPFHTAIYTVGVKQRIPFFNNLDGQLLVELNNFEMSQDFQLQWPYIGYYGHGFVKQGYTNDGQILGAGTGQFGNSQFISYKIFYNKGYSSIFFNRYCPNNNYTYNKAVNNSANSDDSELNKNWYANFPTYLVFGTKSGFSINNTFYIEPELCLIYAHNRLYKYNNNEVSFYGSMKLKILF